MDGAVQRAELFANVDELMEWKRGFEMKQREVIAWMASVDERIVAMNERITNLANSSISHTKTIEILNERIDAYNRRVRKLEKISKMQGGELRALVRRLNDEVPETKS